MMADSVYYLSGWVVIQGIYFVFSVAVFRWALLGLLKFDFGSKPVVRSKQIGEISLGVDRKAPMPLRSASGDYVCARCGHGWKPRSSSKIICPRCKWHI